MKKYRILTILTAALLLATAPLPLSANDASPDFLFSRAPRDADAMLRRVELNVALQQYEKVLTAKAEADLQRNLGPTESGLSEEQNKQWYDKQEKKHAVLQEMAQRLCAGIRARIEEDNKNKAAQAKPELKKKYGQDFLESSEAKAQAEFERTRPQLPANGTATGPLPFSPQRVRRFNADMRVGTIACSPDEKLIAVGNDQPTMIMTGNGHDKVADNWQPAAEILDATTGKSITTLKLISKEEEAILGETQRAPIFEVKSLVFSPDSTTLAVGTSIGQVKLFDARTGKLVRSLDDVQGKRADGRTADKFMSLTRALGSAQSLAFSPDGSLLAVCGGSFADVPLVEKIPNTRSTGHAPTAPGKLKLWDVKTGTLKRDLVGHAHAEAVIFSPDGTRLASLGSWLAPGDYGLPWGVKIWDPVSGQLKRQIETHDNGGPHSVAFSPDSKLVAIGTQRFDPDKEGEDSSSGAVSLTHVASGVMEWLQAVPGWAKTLAFARDGRSIVVLCGGHAVQFLHTETGKLQNDAIRPKSSPKPERWNDIAVAPQANLLAIGGTDAEKRGFIELWDWNGTDASGTSAPKE